MKFKMRWTMIFAVGLFTASLAHAQLQIRVANDPSSPGGLEPVISNDDGNGWRTAPGSFTSDLLRAIKKLNMRPDFNLSVDQKTKIKQARADYDAAAVQWKAAHQGEMMKAMNDVMAALGNQDQQKAETARQALADIGKTAPPISDLDAKVMAILTDDQKKAVQSFLGIPVDPKGAGDAGKP